VQTNNSFLPEKIFLREFLLSKDKEVNVLDCYAGKGVIWKDIKKRYNVNVVGIDKKEYGSAIFGDNIKALHSLNLNDFDYIDLDAYGIPFKQLEIVFNKKYNGVVFFTFIQSGMGTINGGLLEYLGFTKKMIKKCSTMFNKDGFSKFCSYLRIKGGIEKIFYIKKKRKFYGYFFCNTDKSL
jgi:hypothetical protein